MRRLPAVLSGLIKEVVQCGLRSGTGKRVSGPHLDRESLGDAPLLHGWPAILVHGGLLPGWVGVARRMLLPVHA